MSDGGFEMGASLQEVKTVLRAPQHDTKTPPSTISATEVVEPTSDEVNDPQLTIRIPNPRNYMENHYSQWKGQRGKPRCDPCRAHNLKVSSAPNVRMRLYKVLTLEQCDRVRPKCNHCLLGAGKECNYTPVAVPMHRGIPR
jgi:hypothetical protein